MRLRRSHETLNEILAREAGLIEPAHPGSPQDTEPLPPPHDLNELTAALRNVVRDAEPIRLTPLVRVSRETVYGILDETRRAFVPAVKEYRFRQARAPAAGAEPLSSFEALLRQLDAIDDLVLRARPFTGGDQAWVNRAELARRVEPVTSFLTSLAQELAAYRAAEATADRRPDVDG